MSIEIKGGPDDRQKANKLRKRLKRHPDKPRDELYTADELQWLDAWDRHISTVAKGRPKKAPRVESESSQSEPETVTEGGGSKPGTPHGSPTDTPTQPPPASDPLEAPPRVSVAAAPTSSAAGDASDWRAQYRKTYGFSGDGRKMVCEQLAGAWSTTLGALVDDMKKAGRDPFGGLDPRLPPLHAMAVLAFDELLPEKVRMTPRIGLLAITTATVAQRAYHNKSIAEALKDDPETVEYRNKLKKEQERREAHEQLARDKHNAETEAASVQYAEPPAAPPETATVKVPRPVNGHTAVGMSSPAADDGRPLF